VHTAQYGIKARTAIARRSRNRLAELLVDELGQRLNASAHGAAALALQSAWALQIKLVW